MNLQKRNEPIVEREHRDALNARYDYLRHGGTWHVENESTRPDTTSYVAGFLDAMRLLGVRP